MTATTSKLGADMTDQTLWSATPDGIACRAAFETEQGKPRFNTRFNPTTEQYHDDNGIGPADFAANLEWGVWRKAWQAAILARQPAAIDKQDERGVCDRYQVLNEAGEALLAANHGEAYEVIYRMMKDARAASANVDRFDPYRLKVAEECCERLMSACTDAGCPDGVRMDDWIRENVRSTSANVARDVLAERQRQVSTEGWTPEHDDAHDSGQLAGAASCYAAHVNGRQWVFFAGCADDYKSEPTPDYWPWDESWWKPTTPRRDLVKAGALILAEIERLDRALAAAQSASGDTK